MGDGHRRGRRDPSRAIDPLPLPMESHWTTVSPRKALGCTPRGARQSADARLSAWALGMADAAQIGAAVHITVPSAFNTRARARAIRHQAGAKWLSVPRSTQRVSTHGVDVGTHCPALLLAHPARRSDGRGRCYRGRILPCHHSHHRAHVHAHRKPHDRR